MKTILAIVALSNVANALYQWNTCKSISDCAGQGKGTQCCGLAYDANYNAYKGGVKICADASQIIVPLAVKSKFKKHEGWMYSCPYGGKTASSADATTAPAAAKDATPVAVAPATPAAAPSAASDPTSTPVEGKGFQWNTCKSVSDCAGQGKGTQCCGLAYDANYNAYKGGVKICADASQIIVPLAVKSKFTKHEGWMYSCPYGGKTASSADATTAPAAAKDATPVAVAPATPSVSSTGYATAGSLPTGSNCTGTYQCQVQGSCCIPWASTPGGATKNTNVCFPPGSNHYNAVYSNGVGKYPTIPCYAIMAGASALSVSVAAATAVLAIY